jgi:hypothetical protein
MTPDRTRLALFLTVLATSLIRNVWNTDAIRLARFELGIEITLDEDGDFGVVNLAPGSADPFGTRHAFHVLNARITRGAVIRGTIKYPPAAGLGNFDTGMLVVAKAVLWCELQIGCSPTAREREATTFRTTRHRINGSTRRSSPRTPKSDDVSRRKREKSVRVMKRPRHRTVALERLPEALEVGTSLRGAPVGMSVGPWRGRGRSPDRTRRAGRGPGRKVGGWCR